jgi:septal ring factor EnvC (AmiA/AmiB activator)
MKKHLFLVAVVCVLLSWLLAGCGVAQEKYDTVVADRDKAQQELQSVKADLASAQANLKTAQTELETKKTELESSQSKITSLTAEKQALQADYTKLTTDDNAVKQQLSDIKKVYPARYFSSLTELRNWLYGNDISKRPHSTTAEDLYAKALDLQESAMKDGFIISAFIEYLEGNNFLMGCKAVIDGNIFSWDVETDEPIDWSGMYGLLKVK